MEVHSDFTVPTFSRHVTILKITIPGIRRAIGYEIQKSKFMVYYGSSSLVPLAEIIKSNSSTGLKLTTELVD
jgi:hypothetical protein